MATSTFAPRSQRAILAEGTKGAKGGGEGKSGGFAGQGGGAMQNFGNMPQMGGYGPRSGDVTTPYNPGGLIGWLTHQDPQLTPQGSQNMAAIAQVEQQLSARMQQNGGHLGEAFNQVIQNPQSLHTIFTNQQMFNNLTAAVKQERATGGKVDLIHGNIIMPDGKSIAITGPDGNPIGGLRPGTVTQNPDGSFTETPGEGSKAAPRKQWAPAGQTVLGQEKTQSEIDKNNASATATTNKANAFAFMPGDAKFFAGAPEALKSLQVMQMLAPGSTGVVMGPLQAALAKLTGVGDPATAYNNAKATLESNVGTGTFGNYKGAMQEWLNGLPPSWGATRYDTTGLNQQITQLRAMSQSRLAAAEQKNGDKPINDTIRQQFADQGVIAPSLQRETQGVINDPTTVGAASPSQLANLAHMGNSLPAPVRQAVYQELQKRAAAQGQSNPSQQPGQPQPAAPAQPQPGAPATPAPQSVPAPGATLPGAGTAQPGSPLAQDLQGAQTGAAPTPPPTAPGAPAPAAPSPYQQPQQEQDQ